MTGIFNLILPLNNNGCLAEVVATDLLLSAISQKKEVVAKFMNHKEGKIHLVIKDF
jgi:invasion protein IalB